MEVAIACHEVYLRGWIIGQWMKGRKSCCTSYAMARLSLISINSIAIVIHVTSNARKGRLQLIFINRISANCCLTHIMNSLTTRINTIRCESYMLAIRISCHTINIMACRIQIITVFYMYAISLIVGIHIPIEDAYAILRRYIMLRVINSAECNGIHSVKISIYSYCIFFATGCIGPFRNRCISTRYHSGMFLGLFVSLINSVIMTG